MYSCLSVILRFWVLSINNMKLLGLILLIISQLIVTPVELSPIAEEFRPVEATEYRLIEANIDDIGRRRLAPFQMCLLCKCCAAAGSGSGTTNNCATMPCCFGIDCQLPNKPYGVCAFVPKTCNCNSCAV